MKGFTDHIFRNTFADHFGGFDLAVAPFIASKRDRIFKKKYVKDLLPENNTRLPVIPQIMSKSAEDFTVLANYLYDLGHETVNWNLGCPFPMVANKKRGSGMLPHTDRIHAFLDSVIPGIRGTLSIKIRLGWRSADDIFRLVPVLNQYPLEALIIHPRTGIQRYDGEIDLDAFGRCVSTINHPIVYNGDIRTPEDFKRLSLRFEDVNRWMIGRWCLADPFLPVIIKTGKDDVQDKIEKMKQFHEALFDAYSSVLDGPSHILNKMKGFWRYASLPYKDCKKAMKKIKKSRRPDQYLDLVNLFFETDAQLLKKSINSKAVL
jgi:tRNA-dihydrouridine synthase B